METKLNIVLKGKSPLAPLRKGGDLKGSMDLRGMRFRVLAFVCVIWAAGSFWAGSPAQAGENNTNRNQPQPFVVCSGWHALCTASHDCTMTGDKAYCDCLRVSEPHVVETSNIQDTAMKRLTLAQCTTKHPCGTDEAPVCQAIKDGQYEVGNATYAWVSTFSYRGWCDLLKVKPVACDQTAPGYTGNLYWAVCDGAPCTEIQNPSDPNKPLSCQCRVQDTAFLGANGTCTGDNGGIMSSSPIQAWDFEKNDYRIPLPGYQYVQGACAPLQSDAF